MTSSTLAQTLAQTLATRGLAGLELEARLGTSSPGPSFAPGVSADRFRRIMHSLRDLPKDTVHTREYIFEGNKKYVVTTHDSRVLAPPPPVWHTKDRLASQDFAAGFRLSLALEQWAAGAVFTPDVSHATLERHKQRTSFTAKGLRFDLTHVQTSDDKTIYEVEVELLDLDLLYERTRGYVIDYLAKTAGELAAM